MKFSTAVVLAVASCCASGAAGFSAVVPPKSSSAPAKSSTGKTDPVDKGMRSLDDDDATFDPTGGQNPAVIRNNKDEVWVSQVRTIK